MSEEQAARGMTAVVGIVCDELTDQELAALNLTAQLDLDPHGRIFDYGKVASLFTEKDGTKMHQVTKETLARLAMHRLA